jgi:hypothetical protein
MTTLGAASALANADAEQPRPDESPPAQVTPPAVTKGVGWVVSLGGALTTLIAVVNDVLIPNSWASRWVFVLALVALGVTFKPRLRFKWLNQRTPTFVKGNWRVPVRAALVVSAGLSGLSALNASAGGVIGANVPAIHDWQVQLGVISANTALIARDVATIRDELHDVKQETSVDPRKELANLGVAWTTQGFVEALKLGDERAVRLFLDGGMSPTAEYKGAAAVVYILQPGLTISSVPMLTLLVEKGFNLDTILTDNYVMIDPNDQYAFLPPQFHNADPPLQLGSGHFEGPALLWVVIVATWYGPTTHDIDTINFPIQHGADRRIALNYMADPGTDKETPAYTRVLGLLKG